MAKSLGSARVNTAPKGFTLIELLVVIAIIGILAAILFPVFARARENARRSSCQSNLKQIGLGLMQYSQDYDERFVPCGRNTADANYNDPWAEVIQPYMKSKQVFRCPSNPEELPMSFTPTNARITTNYIANGTRGAQTGSSGLNYSRPLDNVDFSTGATILSRSLAESTEPSRTIIVLEFTRRAGESGGFAPNFNSTSPGNGQLWATDHLGTSNYLFVDGHVKAMKPTATVSGAVMYALDPASVSTGGTSYNTLRNALASRESSM